MDKLISFIVPTRNLPHLKRQFDQFEQTTANLDAIEFLIKIDSDHKGAKEFLENEIKTRKFTIKYIQTPRLAGTFSLWVAIEQLFGLISKESYFVQIMSDEPYFQTMHWDESLRKYIHLFPDDVFRLRLSTVKYSNYSTHYECTFRCDSFPIYTRRWLELTEGIGDCWGSDAYQQCVAFHLSLGPGGYYNYYREGSIWRDIPITDIEMGGLEFGVGVELAAQQDRHLRNLKEWRRLTSYKTQERFSYLARRIYCYIWAYEHCKEPFTLVCDRRSKKVRVMNMRNEELFSSSYKLPRVSIFFQNFLRDMRTQYYLKTSPFFMECHKRFMKWLENTKCFFSSNFQWYLDFQGRFFAFLLRSTLNIYHGFYNLLRAVYRLPITTLRFLFSRMRFCGKIFFLSPLRSIKNKLKSRLTFLKRKKSIAQDLSATNMIDVVYYNPPGIDLLFKKARKLPPGVLPPTPSDIVFGKSILNNINNQRRDYQNMIFHVEYKKIAAIRTEESLN